jgi:hypothetical protein
VGIEPARRLVLLAAVALAASLSLPSTSRAEEVPAITSFTATPATVKVGSSTVVSATFYPENWRYHVAIVNTDTGQQVARCVAWATACTYKITIPWSENPAPKDLHLEAEVVPEAALATGSGMPLIVDVERVEWKLSLTASKNPLTVGEKTTLHVENLEPDTTNTGYWIKIVEDETGETVTICAAECSKEVEFPYSMQAEAGPVPIHAEVASETDPTDVAGWADLTLYVDPVPLRVGLGFSEPQTASNGDRTWLASAAASPQPSGTTPFTTRIYRLDGTSVAGCVLWITCTSRVGPGTYRAVVEDSENVYAASQWWTISPGSGTEPEEEAADDFNLLALAALFAGPSDVCTTLLFYPGTHFEGGSVSDQYLACEEAVAAGKSTSAVLRAVAAAGGGTTVLWYLYDEKTKEQTPAEDTEPAEETEPPPAPPVGWPGEATTQAELLRELNPQLETERESRIVIKQCQRLMIRAALPIGNCTSTPIFASGDLDVPQATKHDIEALLYYPGWVRLNYERRSGKSGQGWYENLPVCAERSQTINCDEFPFFSTEQGGGSAKPRPSLKLIDAKQNQWQGNRLGRFYAACGVNVGQGRPFLNVPMPPGSNIPTLILCNGSS